MKCKTEGCKRLAARGQVTCDECESDRLDRERGAAALDEQLRERFRPAEENTIKLFEETT